MWTTSRRVVGAMVTGVGSRRGQRRLSAPAQRGPAHSRRMVTLLFTSDDPYVLSRTVTMLLTLLIVGAIPVW